MMRKILIITGCVLTAAAMVSCGGPRRNPGRSYMPDMAYSRAYETYAGYDTSVFTTEKLTWGKAQQSRIFYNHQPVTGTIARGDMGVHTELADSSGTFAKFVSLRNPLVEDSVAIDMKEAERLFLVNCAICHGAKLDGNGPLYNSGNGAYTAAPKNLLGPDMIALSDGTMFHSLTYGKNMMGSYAAQLSTAQRWMVIAYVRSKQAAAAPAGGATAAAAKTDSTAAATPK